VPSLRKNCFAVELMVSYVASIKTGAVDADVTVVNVSKASTAGNV
jgi:hypothetical protein